MSKTDIYEDKTFFGDYLESTSEKDFFAEALAKRIKQTNAKTLLDIGCFDGTLTKKVALKAYELGSPLDHITAIEPAAAPLKEMQNSLANMPAGTKWDLINSNMDNFLNSNKNTFDWVIASHSLYWMNNVSENINSISKLSKNGAIVMRDPGVLHQIEIKYRPLMTKKVKTFYSSADVVEELNTLNVAHTVQSFSATMNVTAPDTSQFKQLAGFLLDLTLDEIDPQYLESLHKELNVKNGKSSYGIDIIWIGETVSS